MFTFTQHKIECFNLYIQQERTIMENKISVRACTFPYTDNSRSFCPFQSFVFNSLKFTDQQITPCELNSLPAPLVAEAELDLIQPPCAPLFLYIPIVHLGMASSNVLVCYKCSEVFLLKWINYCKTHTQGFKERKTLMTFKIYVQLTYPAWSIFEKSETY